MVVEITMVGCDGSGGMVSMEVVAKTVIMMVIRMCFLKLKSKFTKKY